MSFPFNEKLHMLTLLICFFFNQVISCVLYHDMPICQLYCSFPKRLRCSLLGKLPSAIGLLDKLEELDADCCKYLEGEIPGNFGRLKFFRVLRLTYTNVSEFPKLPESLTSLHFGS